MPRPSAWTLLITPTTVLLALPLATLCAFIIQPSGEVWQHLADTVLPEYVEHSLWLMLIVAIGTLTMGVGTAWLTSMCNFPGRRLLEWALLLPMALPAYIIAYTYTGLLDVAGPLQSGLRSAFSWNFGDYLRC